MKTTQENDMTINRLITKVNFNKGKASRIKYLVIHYVGATGGAEANCKYFENVDRSASAHYFVGHSGEVWQCVDDENIAWHCGAKKYVHKECRNKNSIGIELCCKKKGNSWYFEQATIDSAIELAKEIMTKYSIPIENVLRHYDVTGKNCPAPFVEDEAAWLDFKQKIQNGGKSLSKPAPAPAKVTSTVDNESYIWNFFKSKGLKDVAIAGLMGNLYAESGLKSNNLQNSYNKKFNLTDDEYTTKVDNGSYTVFSNDKAGYGLAQWTFHTRKANLLSFAKSCNKSIGDLDMQLEFLWNELQGYKVVINTFKSTKTIREASNIVLVGFERPADQSDAVKERRFNYSYDIYKRQHKEV